MKLEEYSEHEFLMRLSTVNREEPHSPSIYVLTTGSVTIHQKASPNEPRNQIGSSPRNEWGAINFHLQQGKPGASQLQARPPFATREREREINRALVCSHYQTRWGKHSREVDIRKEYFCYSPGLLRSHLCCGIVSVVIVSGLIAAMIRRTGLQSVEFLDSYRVLIPSWWWGGVFMGCHLRMNSCAGSAIPV
ncbi:hypothetical protein CEXT_299911 [Caerostris extrusa]|uniref:Uncharacterized protein n=1 Tax=Caerostris extrusa TaxID=172846 RepID=A0AAV4X688_CAEEX|nr:hypothetical protein CEXT_299911 [Caerostris extrusa]